MYLGIDVGGTNLAAGLTDGEGQTGRGLTGRSPGHWHGCAA